MEKLFLRAFSNLQIRNRIKEYVARESGPEKVTGLAKKR